MIKVCLFAAEGCEEVEALTTVDILRREGITVDIISLTDNKAVTGSHGIVFGAEKRLSEVDPDEYDGAIVPGGMPGTDVIRKNEGVLGLLKIYVASEKLVAAICAAPSVLGEIGLLEGKKATCYPGFEEKLIGAEVVQDKAVIDGNIITSRGMGTAIDFALAIVEYFSDANTAAELSKSIIYK